MAEQQYFIGSRGPFLFDDQDEYPDTEKLRGARFTQVLLDDAPTEDHESARHQDVKEKLAISQAYTWFMS